MNQTIGLKFYKFNHMLTPKILNPDLETLKLDNLADPTSIFPEADASAGEQAS